MSHPSALRGLAAPLLVATSLVALSCGPGPAEAPDLERSPLRVVVAAPPEVWEPLLQEAAAWEGLELDLVFVDSGGGPDAWQGDVAVAGDLARLGEVVREAEPVRLPLSLVSAVQPALTSGGRRAWVALGARALVVVYDPVRRAGDDVPADLDRLGPAVFTGRLASPRAGRSMEVHLAALRALAGRGSADALTAALETGAATSDGAGALAAVAAGDADVAIVDHDDVVRWQGSPLAAEHLLVEGQPLVDVVGVALLRDRSEGRRLIELLLSAQGQARLVARTGLYPVLEEVEPPSGVPPLPGAPLASAAEVANAMPR